jgi:hypothetical protein
MLTSTLGSGGTRASLSVTETAAAGVHSPSTIIYLMGQFVRIFSEINSVLNTGTLHTDSVVVGGTAYYYATTT